ncbi:MAG: cytochrome c oxidase assembly factor Coa1 family protein [Terracidiphilus sp.]
METIALKPERSWFARNWGWVIAAAVTLFLSFIVAIFTLVLSLFHHSNAVTLAVNTAEANTAFVTQLGRPVKTGWFITGSINVTPDSGSAEFAIPVSGPRASGTLYAQEHKSAGLWHLETLQFGRKDSDERLNLLQDGKAKPECSQ